MKPLSGLNRDVVLMSARFPRVVETYKGIDIWFDPVKGKYYASHCEHTKRDASIKVVKKWIETYKS
jgi:hypothetical protein